MKKSFLVLLISLFVVGSILSQNPGTEPRKSIKVTYPHEGQIIIVSTHCLIIWEKKGNLNDKVRIVLYKSTGEKIKVIAKAASNSGKYSWRVPHEIPEGSYRIKVKAGTISNKGPTFQIKTPIFTLYEPHLNETLTVGMVKKIRWHSVYAEGTTVSISIGIRYYANGFFSAVYNLTRKIPGDQNEYDWVVGKFYDNTEIFWSALDLSKHIFIISVGLAGSVHHNYSIKGPDFFIKK